MTRLVTSDLAKVAVKEELEPVWATSSSFTTFEILDNGDGKDGQPNSSMPTPLPLWGNITLEANHGQCPLIYLQWQ